MWIRYDRKEAYLLDIQDIQIWGAMGPPGGSRQEISPRCLRHFHIIAINPFSDATMTHIFSTILTIHLSVNLRQRTCLILQICSKFWLEYLERWLSSWRLQSCGLHCIGYFGNLSCCFKNTPSNSIQSTLRFQFERFCSSYSRLLPYQ